MRKLKPHKAKSFSKAVPAKVRLRFANAAISTLSHPIARTIIPDLAAIGAGTLAHAVVPGSEIIAAPAGAQAAHNLMSLGTQYAQKQKDKIKAKQRSRKT